MVSPAASTSATEACDASVILDQCVEVSNRLNTITKQNPIASDEPLSILLRKQIQALQTQVSTLKFEVANFDANTVAEALLATKLSLLSTLDLLDFYCKEERRGHDGALNSLFASRHILNQNQDCHDVNAPPYEDKFIRLGKELDTIVSNPTQEPANAVTDAFERHQYGFTPNKAKTFSLMFVPGLESMISSIACMNSFARVISTITKRQPMYHSLKMQPALRTQAVLALSRKSPINEPESIWQ
jgi:hypothetical protein